MTNPVNPENKRSVCSPENPMPKDASGRWEHTNVKEIADWGETATYQCQDCKHTWTEELPQ